jgi:hypothetical protein
MAVAASVGAKTVQRYVIKFQYKPPTTAPTGDDRGHLSTAATTSLSQVKLTHHDAVSFVSIADDSLIDLQSMPTKTDANCEQLFNVTRRPKAYRVMEIWFKIETALSFRLSKPHSVTIFATKTSGSIYTVLVYKSAKSCASVTSSTLKAAIFFAKISKPRSIPISPLSIPK